MTALQEQPPTDAALIAASMGEPEIFALVFDRHSDEIHRYVARRLGPEIAQASSPRRSWDTFGTEGRSGYD